MKKILFLSLFLIFFLGITACQNQDASLKDQSLTNANTSPETSQQTQIQSTNLKPPTEKTIREKGISFSVPILWRENRDSIAEDPKTNLRYSDSDDNDLMVYHYQQVPALEDIYERAAAAYRNDPNFKSLENLGEEIFNGISFKKFHFTHDMTDPGYMYMVHKNQRLYVFIFPEKSVEPKAKDLVLGSIEFTEESGPENLASDKVMESSQLISGEDELALAASLNYVSERPYSRSVLEDQLARDGFSQGSIDYAIKASKIDFAQMAKERAWEEISVSSVSADALYQILAEEGYTVQEITFAIEDYGAEDYVFENPEWDE